MPPGYNFDVKSKQKPFEFYVNPLIDANRDMNGVTWKSSAAAASSLLHYFIVS